MGSWGIQECKHASGNRESELQTGNSDPNSSGSRNWSKEEFDQSIDLRVDGICNDETYKDEEYMQRITNSKTCDNWQNYLKDDSPEDNLQSEKAAKKIYEAGNCELHESQQRSDKVHCQRRYSYIEAGFQVCPCGGKLCFSEELLFQQKTKIKQRIADAYVPFQGTRGAKHGVQPWQTHHFWGNEFMRKINKKGNIFVGSWPLPEWWSITCKPATKTGQKNGANIWIIQNNRYFARSPCRTTGRKRYVL